MVSCLFRYYDAILDGVCLYSMERMYSMSVAVVFETFTDCELFLFSAVLFFLQIIFNDITFLTEIMTIGFDIRQVDKSHRGQRMFTLS